MISTNRARCIALLFGFGLGASAFAQNPPTYSLTDLGLMSGATQGVATSINSSGVITGHDFFAGGVALAWIWQGGVKTPLGNLAGYSQSRAWGINSTGAIAGWASGGGPAPSRAFLYQSGSMIDLGAMPGSDGTSRAQAINDSGVVVGFSNSGTGAHPVMFSGGNVTNLGSLPGLPYGWAYGVNNAGQVVGECDNISTTEAFLWSGGVMSGLGTLPGTSSTASAINNSGVAVGASGSDAVMFANGTVTDLGILPGNTQSSASAINDSGVIVGRGLGGVGARGFVYMGSQMYDLNSLLDASGNGWSISGAFSVNANGQIAGWASFNGGLLHPVLLTPVPEPASLAAVALGAVAMLYRRRKRS